MALAVAAAERLSADGRRARVVSMPCTSVFDAQEQAYRDAVLPPSVTRRLAIEAGVPDGWHRYVGTAGAVLGIGRFGASAPASDLFRSMGFTVDNVMSLVAQLD